MGAPESNLAFEILVVDAAADAAPLQEILRDRLGAVSAGQYVNGHHPNSDTIEGVQADLPEAQEALLEEYKWVAALAAHNATKHTGEQAEKLMRISELAIIGAAKTYDAEQEENFVRHASKFVHEVIATQLDIKDIDNLYEDEAVQALFTPFAQQPLEAHEPTNEIQIFSGVFPGARMPEDLPVDSEVYFSSASDEYGTMRIVKGTIKKSEPYDRSGRIPSEDESPGLVRIVSKESPYVYIADTTSCSIVPVDVAEELLDSPAFAKQWFEEGFPIWAQHDSRVEFLEKLRNRVTIEDRLKNKVRAGVRNKV